MRVFDLMNMQGLNAVRVEEVIICLYKWLNPNTAIDEAIYNGMMSQPFLYTPWRKEHKDLAAIKVGDLVLTPGINMKAIQHFYDAIRKAFFKSEEYNWRWYKFRNRSEYAVSYTHLVTNYEAFADAWDAAVDNEGSTLKLLCDITLDKAEDGIIAQSGKFTLDLNSKTVSGEITNQLLTVSGTARCV